MIDPFPLQLESTSPFSTPRFADKSYRVIQVSLKFEISVSFHDLLPINLKSGAKIILHPHYTHSYMHTLHLSLRKLRGFFIPGKRMMSLPYKTLNAYI